MGVNERLRSQSHNGEAPASSSRQDSSHPVRKHLVMGSVDGKRHKRLEEERKNSDRWREQSTTMSGFTIVDFNAHVMEN